MQGEEREVGSMKTMITSKAEVCTMGTPLDISMAKTRSIDLVASSEHPHLKEHRLE